MLNGLVGDIQELHGNAQGVALQFEAQARRGTRVMRKGDETLAYARLPPLLLAIALWAAWKRRALLKRGPHDLRVREGATANPVLLQATILEG